MWSPSKALFGNRINKGRKIHLHSPGAAGRGSRGRGRGTPPRRRGGLCLRQPDLSSHGPRVTRGAQGTPGAPFSLFFTLELLPSSQSRTFLPPPAPQSSGRRLRILTAWTAPVTCSPWWPSESLMSSGCRSRRRQPPPQGGQGPVTTGISQHSLLGARRIHVSLCPPSLEPKKWKLDGTHSVWSHKTLGKLLIISL